MKFSLRLILLILLAFFAACVLSDSKVNKTSLINTTYVEKSEHKGAGSLQLLKNGLNSGKQLQRNSPGLKMGNGGKGIAGGLKRGGTGGGQFGGMKRKNNPNGGARRKNGRGKGGRGGGNGGVGNGGGGNGGGSYSDSYDMQSSDYSPDIVTGGDMSNPDYVEEDYSLNNNKKKKGKGRGNHKRGNKRNRGRGKGSGSNRDQGGIPDHSLDGFDDEAPSPAAPAAAEPTEDEE